MAGVAAVTRNTDEAVKAGAKSDRGSWLSSLKDESISFLKGDNTAPWAIFAETVIGCVPILGQIVDARDIIKGLVEVSGAPASPMAWFDLITALIGVIPGGGDLVKGCLRGIKKGTTPIEDMLAVLRKQYTGDVEKLLRETLDISKIRGKFNEVLGNASLTKQFSPEVQKSISTIRNNLDAQFKAFQQEVDGWLAKGRKTSADAPNAKKAPGAPDKKPGSGEHEGHQNKADQTDPAQKNVPNSSTQKTAPLSAIANKELGVLGEHMADYHCQEVKGWGHPASHDRGQVNDAKLNDEGKLVQLWPQRIRGRGIDAVWVTSKQPKPYAIVEAKASYKPNKTLGVLLRELDDKTESKGRRSGGASKRRGGSSGGGKTTTSAGATSDNVSQMSIEWVNDRLETIALTDANAKMTLVKWKAKRYCRFVLFFSVPQAESHATALIQYLAGNQVAHSEHASHSLTREWSDADIDRLMTRRAKKGS